MMAAERDFTWSRPPDMAENDPSASSSMPAATAEGAAPLPLFYRRPAPLSALRHFGLSLSATDSFAFARDANAIPLNVSEFSLAARHYPIVFTPTDPVTPVAVVGIAKSRNLFVDAAGKWLAGAYIPAYVRRYPFLFIEDKEKDEFILGIDDAAKALREEAGEKDRLFWEGKPTSLIERAMAFCKEYQSDLNFTRKFCAALEEDRLLADKEAGVALKDGKKFRLTGFRIVDEAKFDKLPAKPLLQLRLRRKLVGFGLLDDAEAGEAEILPVLQGDARLLVVEQPVLFQRRAEFPREVQIGLVFLAEGHRPLDERRRLALPEQPVLFTGFLAQGLGGIVDAQDEFVLLLVLDEQERVAPHIGRDIGAGEPFARRVDEKIAALGNADHGDRRDRIGRGEDDGVMPRGQAELADIERDGVGVAGEGEAVGRA